MDKIVAVAITKMIIAFLPFLTAGVVALIAQRKATDARDCGWAFSLRISVALTVMALAFFLASVYGNLPIVVERLCG